MTHSAHAIDSKAAGLEAERARLTALAATQRRHEFIDQAMAHLSKHADRGDAELALLLIQGLVTLGLGGVAREVLRHASAPSAGLDTPALRRNLAAVPTGRAPWGDLAPHFEANAQALLDRSPAQFAAVVDQCRQTAKTCDLFRTTAGAFHLSKRLAGKLRHWIPGFIDNAAIDTMELPLNAAGPATVIVGVGLDTLIERAHTATTPRENAEAAPLFVVDDTIDSFAAWMHLADRRKILRDERVYLFIGPEAAQSYASFLLENDDLALPTAFLTSSRAGELGVVVKAASERAAANRDRALRELITVRQGRTRDRSPRDRAQRLKPGAAIVGFTSRFTTMLQYAMRDIGSAVEELGYTFHLVIEPQTDRQHTWLTTARAVHEHDPALVVLINHFRKEYAMSFGETPVLTWVQDPVDTVFSRSTSESIGPLDFICGYYRHRCVDEFNYPPDQYFSTKIPVSSRLFHDAPTPSPDRERLACDIMYVGHLHESVDEVKERWRAETPAEVHPVLDRLAQFAANKHACGEFWRPDVRPLVNEYASALGIELADELAENIAHFYGYRIYDLLFRREALLWAARWAEQTGRIFRLYGRGWSGDPVLNQFAAGPLEHGEQLRRAYAMAKIVLQPAPHGFLHQRTFEALASGSLVLARYCPGEKGNRVFPNLDPVTFGNETSFFAKCSELIEHDEPRRRLTQEFRSVVLRRFTYTAVMKQMIENIRNQLGGARR